MNKNQFGDKAPISLHRTQVSRKITTIGNNVVTLKKDFYKDAVYISIFLDESTTTAMETRPVYCGLIGIKSNFEWLMCFAGQTNTAGCETGEVYFNTVKDVFSTYDIWSKKKSIGTDGCHSMRSTSKYAGVDAHGSVGESFIAYANRNIGSSNVLAFHLVLHIISLAVGDCVTLLDRASSIDLYIFCSFCKKKRAFEEMFFTNNACP